MKRNFIVFICLLLFPATYGQSLSGIIKGNSGEAIPYATIYIEQLRQGTVANEAGEYSITIPKGTYKVIYQSLGFKPEIRNIEIGEGDVSLNIVLVIQNYTIPEVKVMASGEDPAYSIMRKAIGLAPYHLNRVKSYTADVYLKGNLIMTNIPRVMRKSFKINDTQIKEGDRFIMESFNNIEFSAPDKYIQKVISQRTNFPSAGNSISPMDFIKSSFYQPNIGSVTISPLAPEALSHYRFEYLGANKEGDYLINKIKVTPRRKSQQLWSGTIYIIEDLWCIHSLSLSNESIAGVISVDQIYTAVDQGIWLPVTHQFDIDVSILGVKGFAGYGGSVKYLSVVPDPSLPVPESVSYYISQPSVNVTAGDEVQTKPNKEIEAILAKNDISNREMARLGKLMEKEVASVNKKEKPELQIIEKTTYIIEEDAGRKDSSFWASIRPIPLSKEDKPIVVPNDTLPKNLSSTPNNSVTIAIGVGNSDKPKKNFRVIQLFTGKTWRSDSGFVFTMDGLAKLDRSGYNPVDGFYYGTGFRISQAWDKINLGIYPSVGYYFGRDAFNWNVNSTISFNYMKQEQIYVRAGTGSRDMNSNGGIKPNLNTFTSLLFKQNYQKLYETGYITIGHSIELFNGFYLNLSGTLEDRTSLQNSTNFSFFYKSRAFDPNIPDNIHINNGVEPEGVKLFNDHRSYQIMTQVTYTPNQRYRIIRERKIPATSEYPTIGAKWIYGANADDNGTEEWHHISGDISYRTSTGAMTSYRALLRAGGFIKRENLRFNDFKHTNNQPLALNLGVAEDVFMLKPFYSLATPNPYVELHTRYTSPTLLLKRLPVLSNTLIRENLNLALFYSEGSGFYSEAGYSLSELFLIGELGVYTGFSEKGFYGAGVRLSIRFN